MEYKDRKFYNGEEPVWFWNTNKQKLDADHEMASTLMIQYICRMSTKSKEKVLKSNKKYVQLVFDNPSEHKLNARTEVLVKFTDKEPKRWEGNYTFHVGDVQEVVKLIKNV